MEEKNKEIQITTVQAIATVILAIMLLFFAVSLADLITNSLVGSAIYADIIFAVLYIVIIYFGVKFISEKFLKISMCEYGVKLSNIKLEYLGAAFVLPLLVCIALMLTGGNMLNNNFSTNDNLRIIFKAIFRVGIGAGFTEELIFRGLIMKTIEKKWGIVIAVTVPSIIFAALHYRGGLSLADFYLVLIAGTSVAIMFSLIAYKSGSVLNSAIMHGVWNIIMIGNILKIGVAHVEDAIFSYDLSQSSKILTGGNFGVEVSIFAIVGYLIVILFTLCKTKIFRNID